MSQPPGIGMKAVLGMGRASSIVAVAALLPGGGVLALDLPGDLVAGLGSEVFAERQKSEDALDKWCRGGEGTGAMTALLRMADTSPEAEVRQRCAAILKRMVLEEFDRNGSAFLGVSLAFKANPVLPENGGRAFGLMLQEVVPGTPGSIAGLQTGDVLIALDGKEWESGDTDQTVTAFIKSHKPGTKVTARVLRNGVRLEIPVALGKRPALLDTGPGGALPPFGSEEFERADAEAREEYFRDWRERKSAEMRKNPEH